MQLNLLENSAAEDLVLQELEHSLFNLPAGLLDHLVAVHSGAPPLDALNSSKCFTPSITNFNTFSFG